ncbi:MAG: hypothetical protein U1E69_04580 [Tabrizicola sp.]|uniref:imm11 family protein n=1 Tax=Tabrizicola sp. TaxID=2005166 RepID=UPI002ABBC9CC|nr:DUF1629 domain-containing protein [Tabrizicola sp.]MDZ4086060.1 hypothetical protein [Tabrizicola sp.]
MVWGVVVPSSFGDFRPEGNFVGWEERLDAYYHKELADGPLKAHMPRASFYRSGVLRKFLYELGDLMPDGLRVERPLPHEWPEEYRTAKTHDKLGSLIEIDGFLAVDERLKALIEAIEPGVHDFRPIRITMPRGKDYPVPYHVLLIGQFRDSFRPELSTDGAWYGKPGDYTVHDEKKAFAGSAMSSEATVGLHLWRERNLDRPEFCLSDGLQDVIAKAGLRMMKHYKMKSV